MSESGDAFSVTGVTGGLLDEAADAALLTFEAEAGALSLVLPATELPALLSVCVGLTGQKLPSAGDADHPTIPIGDWRVGVTCRGLVVALAPESGGALAFHLRRDQAEAIFEALRRALELSTTDSRPAAGRRDRH